MNFNLKNRGGEVYDRYINKEGKNIKMEKKNNSLVVVTIILVVLLIVSIGYILYSNKDNLKDNKTNNTQNTTITAEEKEKAVNEIKEKFNLDSTLANCDNCLENNVFPKNKKIQKADEYTKIISIYVDEKLLTKFDKCTDSIKNELVQKGILTAKENGEITDIVNNKCESFSFITQEELEKQKDKYFGKAAKLTEVFKYDYLPQNKIYVYTGNPLDTSYGTIFRETTLYDIKMPSKDTVEFYFNASSYHNTYNDVEVAAQKEKYTFKKEDSNWVFYSVEGL